LPIAEAVNFIDIQMGVNLIRTSDVNFLLWQVVNRLMLNFHTSRICQFDNSDSMQN